MPFAYKLAYRLARLKHRTLAGAAAAVAAAVVLSCELPVQVAKPNATVSQLIITPRAVTLQLNQNQDFVAVGLSAAGDTTPSTVSWTVTGGAITDMGSSGGRHYGQYHGGTCGSFTVAATSHPDGTTDAATVTVAGCVAPVASVTVSPSAPTVQVGQTAQLTATPKDANGTPLSGRAVTWSSNNTGVAMVDGSGLVTAVATGAATITATSEGQSGTALVRVSNVPVASVTVTPSSANVQQGATVQLTATPRDANGTALPGRVVTWASTNTAVATVSGSGLVSGAGAGSATITATSEGQSGTAAISVTAPTGQLAIGDSVQTTGSTWVRNIAQPPADPATGTPPSVIGTQPAGARGVVDSGPVLNTTPGGDGAIRYHVLFAAAPSGWVVQDYLAKIVPTVPVASVTVTPASVSVLQGQAVQLTATPKDANGNPLTGRTIGWSSSDNTIATVNSSGLVTGVGPGGPVTITATSEGQSGMATVTVTVAPVASVTVTPSSASVAIGRTVQLTATPKDASGNPLTGRAISWSSSDNTIATVSSSGLVTGVVAGSVTITATSEGTSGTASIAVSGVPVASVTVSPASASVQAGQTQQLTATLKDANGNVLTGRTVAWSSNNTTVATVNGTGLVTAKVAGSATITAMSEGQSGTAAMTVTPVPVASVTVTPATAGVTVGSTVQLTATPKDANGNPLTGRVITWQSSNSAIASVNGSGLVSGAAAGGPATITATSEGQSGTAAVTVTTSTGAQFDHVFIVLEENNDYASVTSSSMPYLTGLAAQYGLATQYYANTHPSIGNYLDMTSGTVLTNDDSYSGSPFNVPNIFRSLIAAGKSWKGYAEDLPSTGFVDYTQIEVGQFASRHFPPIYYTDVHDNPAQAQNVVPFTQFATDLANGTLPNYSFIVPNLCNDAHDCSLNTADSWLQQNIDPLVRSAFFQQNNCLLIITFDEAGGDNTNGGGRVYWVAVSPTKSKRGYVSTTQYQHQSTLRLMLKGLGVTSFPSDAATAPDMSEFFTP
jgi:uncharacterized protein YjdB